MTLALMDIFTARPENLFRNVTLASLLVGFPVGLAITLIGIFTQPSTAHTASAGVFAGVLLAPAFIFIAGVILLVPLYGLRKIGYAGPFFVYIFSAIFSLVLVGGDIRVGLISFALSLPASYVFSRYAYREN